MPYLDKNSFLNKGPLIPDRPEPLKKPDASSKSSFGSDKKSVPFASRPYTDPIHQPLSTSPLQAKPLGDTSVFGGKSELSKWESTVNLMNEMKKIPLKERIKLGIPLKDTELKKFAQEKINALPQDQWTNIIDKSEAQKAEKILDRKRVADWQQSSPELKKDIQKLGFLRRFFLGKK